MLKGKAIAEDTGISKTQAQRIIKHWSDIGKVEPSSHRGRPQALIDRDIRHLVCLSDSHPRATLAEITNETGIKKN
jgi:transposase